MEKSIVICGFEEIENYKTKIIDNLNTCTEKLKELLDLGDSLKFFKRIKYEKTVIDPFTGEPENLIEVINQCQTYLVSLMGTKCLLSQFPDTPFIVNLGNVTGYDIKKFKKAFIIYHLILNRKMVLLLQNVLRLRVIEATEN